MYIWILLATIMVALSFFNLSPRADKDNAVSEVKASAVLNRFRAEHGAMVSAVKCESILHKDTLKNPETGEGGWTSHSEEGPVSIPNDVDFGYVKYTDNLPIGYTNPDGNPSLSHYVVCIDSSSNISDATPNYKNCFSTGKRYLISFAQIPSKWLTKRADENGYITPTPLFLRFLSGNGPSGIIYGWTSCNGATEDAARCVLHGKTSIVRTYEKDTAGELQAKINTLPADAAIWRFEGFQTQCGSKATPCVFAYTRLTNNDKGKYCKNKYEEWKNSTH